jgi:predicted  nucleic acid-binding Zn-ribbon protein
MKKGASNGPTPIAATVSPTVGLDVGEEWLKRYVKALEDDVEAVKAENTVLRKQVLELTGDRATFMAQNEALREDIAGLRAEIQELRGQLRGRGSGR